MRYSQKVNGSRSKQINQQLVLQIIQGRGPISRIDIARISGLSAGAVSGITGLLVGQGLVQEVGEAESEGRAGRKAILLRLNPDAGYVVGVTVGAQRIVCAITDLNAKVLRYSEQRLPFASKRRRIPKIFPPEQVIQAVIDIVENQLAAAQVDRTRLLGIGVGINGVVDSERGVSILAPHFGWRDVSVVAPLAKHFGIPVLLENDARALTIAEHWFGAGRGVDHFVSVVAGLGIGAGVVANGHIYRGAGGAGEFGHIVLQPDGPLCSCGRHGCVDSLASVPAIIREIGAALTRGEASTLREKQLIGIDSIDDITDAADAGDALAQHALADAGRWLGAGVACLVNVLNPQLIIVIGEAVRFGHWYIEPMKSALRQLAFANLASQVQIAVEPLGGEMWARGAACVVLGALFTSPVPEHEPQLQLRIRDGLPALPASVPLNWKLSQPMPGTNAQSFPDTNKIQRRVSA